MALLIDSHTVYHVAGLAQQANDDLQDEIKTASELANTQNASRWTINTEAMNFATSYRDRLLAIQEKMDTLAAKVDQFTSGLTESEKALLGVDDNVETVMAHAGRDTEQIHLPEGGTPTGEA